MRHPRPGARTPSRSGPPSGTSTRPGRRQALAYAGLLLLLLPCRALAQDALYDPAPPPGSAFVRIVNAGGAAQATRLGARDFGAVPPKSVGAYRVVHEGTRELSAGSIHATFTLKEGGFYTLVVPSSGAPTLLDDPVLSSRSKALVSLYNLGAPGAWDLKTADGSVALVQGVTAPGVGSREVNGIKVDLAAFSSDAASPPIGAVQLERGNAYSFILFSAGGKPLWVQNTTSTR